MIAGPGPEETMVSGPMAEETMVAAPGMLPDASETAMFTPGDDMPPPMPVADPTPEEPPPMPAAAEAEPEPVVAEAEPPAPEPEREREPQEAYVACSNHSHLPAVGLCPGCLEPFCVDCLPEREDGLMVCNRCAGISYRLAVAAPSGQFPPAGSPDPAPSSGGGAPAPGGLPAPGGMPTPAPVPAAEEGGDKKKRWPF
jgi:hypothetical protein